MTIAIVGVGHALPDCYDGQKIDSSLQELSGHASDLSQLYIDRPWLIGQEDLKDRVAHTMGYPLGSQVGVTNKYQQRSM